ncbi:hypothetical protein HELRODRAFT_104248 [Helobdella robusta]|uniref:Receptor expression-enhancing protein n=1 Tax=Helobdella robusta TaxID=6412 RepID=T1EDK6_HELRO|nr:hypothetical protein HELRODRAFT_104248 [Helobdella robusta]ESN91013.1 hypothetical protein HELRODRAFT_104248 [Helobdella robusta]
MAQVKKYVQDVRKVIDDALKHDNVATRLLQQLEDKTGVKKINFVFGLIVFIAIYLMVGFGGDFLCNFLGFLYPAYASIKAVESKEKDDDTKWLTYWVVYSIFHLLEYFTDIFLFWIPLYWFFKCAFLVYCMIPTSFNGSITIYNKVIRPYVLRYEKTVDSHLDKAKEVVKDIAKELKTN